MQGLVLDRRVQILFQRVVVLALGHVHQHVERRLVVGARQERRRADLGRAVHIGQSVKLMMGVNGHRGKRVGGVPKVPRAHETGGEPDEQRGQHAHHHQETDDVAQRDHGHFGDFLSAACERIWFWGGDNNNKKRILKTKNDYCTPADATTPVSGDRN